jgi:hypothetical protein
LCILSGIIDVVFCFLENSVDDDDDVILDVTLFDDVHSDPNNLLNTIIACSMKLFSVLMMMTVIHCIVPDIDNLLRGSGIFIVSSIIQ